MTSPETQCVSRGGTSEAASPRRSIWWCLTGRPLGLGDLLYIARTHQHVSVDVRLLQKDVMRGWTVVTQLTAKFSIAIEGKSFAMETVCGAYQDSKSSLERGREIDAANRILQETISRLKEEGATVRLDPSTPAFGKINGRRGIHESL